MTAPTSQLLAEFSRTARPPAPIRQRAQIALWHVTSRAAQAISGPKVDALRSALPAAPAGSGVRVPGMDAGLSAADAALVVAFAARTVREHDLQVAETVTAVALAIGQVRDVSLGDVVDATAVGLEVGVRLARAVEASTPGWDPTGVAGPIAGACAALRLTGPADGRAEQVLGIAATQAAGLQAARTTDAWALHAGKAAANAVEAALLQEAGFTGPTRGLEGRRGLLPVAAPSLEIGAMTDALGTTWEVDAPADGTDLPREVDAFFTRSDASLNELLDLATREAANAG